MDSTAEFAQRQWRLVDQTQWRYEVIRPRVLCADRTATPRAHETATHLETVRTLHRRFRQQGMVGLLPATIEVRFPVVMEKFLALRDNGPRLTERP
jgi:hypothetical protein